MDFSNVQLSIISGKSDYYGIKWSEPTLRHNDPFSRLYWIRSGMAWTRHHGQQYTLEPGKLFIVPANTISYFGCPRKMHLEWVHFNATVAGSVDLFTVIDIPYAVPVESSQETQHLMSRLQADLANNTPEDEGQRLRMDGTLRILLSEFFRQGATSRTGKHIARLHPALAYIHKNYARRITLGELAACVHLHPTYFSNLFSRLMGKPPLEHLLCYRIRISQIQIESTSKSMQEIAQDVGFCDVYYFSRCFKRVTGMTPGEFRERCKMSRP